MKGKTILLVEDNLKVIRNNSNVLRSRGVKVLKALNLAEARKHLHESDPDAAVIDIMLSDGSGIDLLMEIRSSAKSAALPILLLTAKGESHDIVNGLSTGADDYLAKPYDLDVFAARIEALLRRTSMLSTISNSITIGFLRFDIITNQVFYKGIDLSLSQKEFALLFLLAQNEGKTLSPQYLYEKVWNQPFKDSAALKTHIYNLKKKLAVLPAEILIESSWGEGYSLVKS